jgi:hypothetical protein
VAYEVFLSGRPRTHPLSGPSPHYRPSFPAEFLDLAQDLVRRRTARAHLRQRARLALLLHQQPGLSNVEAGLLVELHPNAVRRWRRRWALGQFSLEDQPGRGRKPTFSPPGPVPRRRPRL